jgi:hypothetical protein
MGQTSGNRTKTTPIAGFRFFRGGSGVAFALNAGDELFGVSILVAHEGPKEIVMSSKYSQVRRDLEAARERLDGSDELDVAVSLVLDQVIETVLKIEHMKSASNVIPFPNTKMTKLAFLLEQPSTAPTL